MSHAASVDPELLDLDLERDINELLGSATVDLADHADPEHVLAEISLPSPPTRAAEDDDELSDDDDPEADSTMQRSGSRPYGLAGGGSSNQGFSLFTSKNGQIDRTKVGLVLVCFILALWIFYDICLHRHQASYNDAVRNLERGMRSSAGDAEAIGGVLRAPGSANGVLPTSNMFRNLPTQSTSFLSDAGVLAFPLQPEHVLSKQVNGVHVATLLPGATRGNHLHNKHSEVLVLVHGHFLLRVAMLGTDGVWAAEDHIFEIGLPGNPFSSATSTISSAPIGVEIPSHVCHALRNLDPASVGFFTSYYVLGMDEQREEPDRQICKAQPKAFLA